MTSALSTARLLRSAAITSCLLSYLA